MENTTIPIRFDAGTLLLEGDDQLKSLPGCQWDGRTQTYRAEARWYRAIVEHLYKNKIPFQDDARQYEPSPWPLRISRDPFPHQEEALHTWWNRGARGVVVLPTGTGKTHLAVMAIAKAGRPTIVVTPTIDLLNEWYDELTMAFDVPVGLLGGGYYDIQPLTITTYDSAYIHLERCWNRFGLLIYDECHHLPSPGYQLTAVGSLAPFRLGLTATPERTDGQEAALPQLVGPIVFRKEIKQLAGQILADFYIEKLYVELSAEERESYQKARDTYRGFVESNGIFMSGKNGWQRFLQATCHSAEGRAAFQAYREQKRLALAAPAKLHLLEQLLDRHVRDRVLIFTYDNATVYMISRRFLIPAITHQTKTKERQKILKKFHSGDFPFLVTSQVLNEGVNVPAANVGIILSGTGSVREHVQRLGRLLRKHGEKQATLYEVVTRGTAEEFTSDRRRQHHAYQ